MAPKEPSARDYAAARSGVDATRRLYRHVASGDTSLIVARALNEIYGTPSASNRRIGVVRDLIGIACRAANSHFGSEPFDVTIDIAHTTQLLFEANERVGGSAIPHNCMPRPEAVEAMVKICNYRHDADDAEIIIATPITIAELRKLLGG